MNNNLDSRYFDRIINRRGSNSMKWDEDPNTLPLWVADMDFRTAPCIIEALRQRVEHGIFGYTFVPDKYYNAVIEWFDRQHGWRFERRDVIYTSGVVPAISAILKAVTHPGDAVVVQTPAYNCFFSSVRNNGCRLVANELIYTPDGYFIDFEALESNLALPEVKAMILCNPHNPVGRVWTRDELVRIASLCLKHHVFVISDEIHCEFSFTRRYTPFGSVVKDTQLNYAICVSASKAFNIAGLQIANIVVPNDEDRKKIDRAINDNEVCDVNPFGVIATIEAYTHGLSWLTALREYLYNNYLYVKDFFDRNFPQYPVTPLEATYLAWINVKASGMTGRQFCDMLKDRVGVALNDGEMYGAGGEYFVRLNFACPRSTLEDALNRIASLR